jgi:hypothetical protein
MKTIAANVFPVILLLLVSIAVAAQHCPFDGTYAIAIHIDKPLKGKETPEFYLLEIEGDRKDSCRFTSHFDSTRFNTEKEIRAKMAADLTSTKSRYLPHQLKKDHNFLKGNQVVFLNMSEKDCMVPRGNEYQMIPRQFVIQYTINSKTVEKRVPVEAIYKLCGTGGSWKRIIPLELTL